MKQWSLFLVSIGCILVMFSYLMPNPLLLIVSGLALAAIGILQCRKK